MSFISKKIKVSKFVDKLPMCPLSDIKSGINHFRQIVDVSFNCQEIYELDKLSMCLLSAKKSRYQKLYANRSCVFFL